MRDYIDAAAFKEMILCANAALHANTQAINDLNVFPVPDGDTGTNMGLTMSNAAAELKKKDFTSIADAAYCVSGALLRGARGNSGVILSLLFRGISKRLKGLETAGAAEFAGAMVDGVDAAYKAVMKPAEGTILTVSRLASAAVAEAAEEGLERALERAVEAGEEALADTVNQNPVLKKAGVIDAGGKGYMIILTTMLASLRGEVRSDALSSQAEAAAKEGGVVIALSECADGIGGDDFYAQMSTEETPQELLDRFEAVPMDQTPPDQWQSQVFARVLAHHPVIVVTRPELKKVVEDCKCLYAATAREALEMALEMKGRDAKVTVIPDGVSVVVEQKK